MAGTAILPHQMHEFPHPVRSRVAGQSMGTSSQSDEGRQCRQQSCEVA